MTVTDKTARFPSGSRRLVFLVVPRSTTFTYQGLIYIRYDCLTHINRYNDEIETWPILVDLETKEGFAYVWTPYQRSGNPIKQSDAKKTCEKRVPK
jgi:hypothetical protein